MRENFPLDYCMYVCIILYFRLTVKFIPFLSTNCIFISVLIYLVENGPFYTDIG